MEYNQLKSVVSLVDSLVCAAHVRRSRELFSSPVRAPLLAPVSSKSLTDFSICRILGLENDGTQSSPSFECHSATSPPLSPYSDCTRPRPSHRETSPPLTPCSDITSSSSDCDSEPDQAPSHSEQLPKKKLQRTTFSPNEVWELEQAFRRRPYLISKDEEELVQRLGIPAKSVKFWFQNRRAKSRKLERKITSVCQTNPSNQFALPVRAAHSRRLQFISRSPSDYWKKAKDELVSSPTMKNCLVHQPYSARYSRPITPDSLESLVKSNQFRGDHSFPLPMFHHADQFKIRSAKPARLPYSRALHRFQPY